MDANKFGKIFTCTTFGESHGSALGVVIDGMPAGIRFDEALLLSQLARRRPGQSDIVSARDEKDKPQVLSGIFQGKTLGTPIAVIVSNENIMSKDYEEIKSNPRPGHADKVWSEKYKHWDHRGGGRSSGRETLSRVISGAFAEMLLMQYMPELKVLSYCSQIGDFKLSFDEHKKIQTREYIDQHVTRFPSQNQDQVQKLLIEAKEIGESYGGVVSTKILNLPEGIGEPVFFKLKSLLAMGIMSIGATQSFEIGSGRDNLVTKGTEFHQDNKNYGGFSGGMSNGDEIFFQVGFKPTSSILDVAKSGRHDPCIVPRACIVVEAMAWITLADLWLLKKINN